MSAVDGAEPPVVVSVREEPPSGCTVVPFLFHSAATACRGRLFLPDGGAAVQQVVVLAHGFCMLQTFEPINTLVRALIAAKVACVTFDYRGFGESDVPTGSPRQLLDPLMLLEDWRAAVRAVGAHPSLAKAAIGLWGTSFSGGHVVATAADHRPDSPTGGSAANVSLQAADAGLLPQKLLSIVNSLSLVLVVGCGCVPHILYCAPQRRRRRRGGEGSCVLGGVHGLRR